MCYCRTLRIKGSELHVQDGEFKEKRCHRARSRLVSQCLVTQCFMCAMKLEIVGGSDKQWD
jgi:hypothetical protein